MRLGDNAGVSTSPTPIDLKRDKHLSIDPGAMAVVQTLEELYLSKRIAGRIGPKRDLLRHGIFVSAGPQIDPGFRGRLTVNLINLSPRAFVLTYEEPFLTIEFHKLSAAPDKPYAGEYQGRKDLTRDELEVLAAYQGTSLAEIYKGFSELQRNLNELKTWNQQSAQMLAVLGKLSSAETASGLGTASRLDITSVDPEPYEMIRSVPVIIQKEADAYIAGFFEANLHASGTNEQEAFDNLRSLILDMYDSLLRDVDTLGPEPKRQLGLLQTYLKRRA